jgi:outer membrane protein insertion porin family
MPTAWLCGVWLIASGSVAALADDAIEGERSAPGDAPRVENQVEKKDKKEPRGRFVLGMGFNPDEGAIFAARVENDRLFGSRHGLSLSAELSRRRQDFRLRYDIGDLADSGIDVRAELFNTRRLYTGFARQGVGGSLRLSRSLSSTTRAYLGYRGEHVSIDSDFPLAQYGASAPGAGLWGSGLVSAVRAGVIYDSRDRRYAPRRGTRAEVFVERADPRIGSDFDLTRVGASVSHHRRLFGPLILRVSGGASAVWSPSGGVVPLAERLQLEGHSDVRGFGLGSAGPTLFNNGEALAAGGNVKAGGRVELELPLIRRLGISATAFYDAAMVRDLDGLGAVGNGFNHAAGFGLIWRSPIGPLRFDWAIPLNGPDRFSAPIFLFSLGQSF